MLNRLLVVVGVVVDLEEVGRRRREGGAVGGGREEMFLMRPNASLISTVTHARSLGRISRLMKVGSS